QQAALAFLEDGALSAYATTFAFDETGALARLLASTPGGERPLRQLRRRALRDLPRDRVQTQPALEIARTVADKLGAGAVNVDRLWDVGSHAFTRGVAKRLDGVGGIYAYEYTALEAFRRAGELGVARILDFPSLNSRAYEALQDEQKRIFPELVSPNDAYFKARFEARQARRDAETAMAQVIITNSSLTRRSHVEGGADPARTFVVPYGAPETLVDPATFSPRTDGPLRAVWAGTFNIRKGAHYLLQSWRSLPVGAARLEAYGAIDVPPRILETLPDGVTFKGSIPQSQLLQAFAEAEVLVFPTLSDGFGLVVTEAFSQGLPVITTDQAGAADLVEHGRNGLIVPAGDAKALAEALAWCLDNRVRLFEMRAQALETARGWQWSDYRRALREAVARGLAL
ncbi:MAG TPA: glycosyltransferase family 4 protein, partial [Caulobacteraceae bacterium]|nr:glycosyltransferase family 4 protein [Caulobacteraceae bacterium]